MNYWTVSKHVGRYLDDISHALPLAEVQLDMIFRIIGQLNPEIKSFLDLGCGDGLLGRLVYERYPSSRGVFLDLSGEMIQKAQQFGRENAEFVVEDFGKDDWFRSIHSIGQFDLVVSRFAIHHIEDSKKRRLYADVFRMLNPKGIFLNLEHVSSATSRVSKLWRDLFIGSLLEFNREKNPHMSKKEVIDKYTDPQHEAANLLSPVEEQCRWLREIGFQNVDCFFKIYELALFGGTKL